MWQYFQPKKISRFLDIHPSLFADTLSRFAFNRLVTQVQTVYGLRHKDMMRELIRGDYLRVVMEDENIMQPISVGCRKLF